MIIRGMRDLSGNRRVCVCLVRGKRDWKGEVMKYEGGCFFVQGKMQDWGIIG